MFIPPLNTSDLQYRSGFEGGLIAWDCKHIVLYLSRVMRKSAICICENKGADHAFVFATHIVQSLYFLNQKFQASNGPLWLYSAVCVGPGRNSRIQCLS